jgi:hypothetical protein
VNAASNRDVPRRLSPGVDWDGEPRVRIRFPPVGSPVRTRFPGSWWGARDSTASVPATRELIAAGDVLLQMGSVNEAIVSYNAALVQKRLGQPDLGALGVTRSAKAGVSGRRGSPPRPWRAATRPIQACRFPPPLDPGTPAQQLLPTAAHDSTVQFTVLAASGNDRQPAPRAFRRAVRKVLRIRHFGR